MNNTPVRLVQIYQCLAQETRLQIMHLLMSGPLGVNELQALLRASQVKVSKHLAYLRRHGVVHCTRTGNRRIYQLPTNLNPELDANLKCLRQCADVLSAPQAEATTGQPPAPGGQRTPRLPKRPPRRAVPPPPAQAPEPRPTLSWPFYGGDQYLD
jgi:ArsR family transcriptional regulator